MHRSSAAVSRLRTWVEAWLEDERAQLPLWCPVALGAGICAWFALPTSLHWVAWVVGWLGFAMAVGMLGRGGRLAPTLATGAMLLAAGCLLIWAKALLMGAMPLARPAMVELNARVTGVESLLSRGLVRLDLAPLDRPDLPRRIRVNAEPAQLPQSPGRGDVVALRTRLMPPAPSAVPGAYDFAERAYFAGIGASGRVIGTVRRVSGGDSGPGARARMAAHIAERLPGGEGAIAVTLATGDRTRISEADAEAMRRSGLAHLLSISGLHVSALIGGVMLVAMRLLALSPGLALRWPILLVAACLGGVAGIAYTLFTGAEVPTVRSCIAALLVICGLALGREAISLRMIAVGALIVMLFWPESVPGPSFQMSFAAVTAIVALYEYPPARAFFARREEARWRRLLRHLGALLATGLVVEIVLTPIAFAHFHRAGLLGALANMIAIPLTSFVIMPFEALALMLDIVGLGRPAWWIVEAALALLLALAHFVADQPFATMVRPTSGNFAFALAMIGFIWLMLWRSRVRWLGAPAAVIGLAFTLAAPAPDVLVTADGRHVALRVANGEMALLRDRAGDYVRTTLAEAAGYEGAFAVLADTGEAACSRDLCEVTLRRADAESVRLLMTRSSLRVPWQALVAACARADVAIADRRLPNACLPRWAKLDRPVLAAMGGAMISLRDRRIIGGRDPRDEHPWIIRDR
ncbi:ComEC/Rec2 family competence protein [Sphingobium lignivorans]|uniref:Competence protein ComEC n=1 Tax=Sphingobium lignivorans TaxID=2735886 RepID=A0ABR6NGN5_9SPHN|nr:ComEC/Rec2 family competence protein [Sphingobium lignivorans]MBB5986440.1 competence protein ComEC [Sphingobium lignivorans]